ncbi:MAG: hypothetical protein HeimC3_33790 [Candidatus Heimdallarchaeota archaeon LC_3]|nr:MAG: hypothetical protein HeimC3_33790 [Candidatus Heimdallarchaeota archaeon LC_3]
MKLKKRRLGRGRLPVGMGREGIIKKIEELTLSIDRWARVIPGRFFRCKATQEVVEIIPNMQNKKTREKYQNQTK